MKGEGLRRDSRPSGCRPDRLARPRPGTRRGRSPHGDAATVHSKAFTNDEVAARSDSMSLAVPSRLTNLRSRRGRLWPGTRVSIPSARDVQGDSSRRHIPENLATEFVRALLPRPWSCRRCIQDHSRLGARQAGCAARCDEFVCGDTPEVRERTIELLSRIPALRPLDAGGLTSARAIEHMTRAGDRAQQRQPQDP